MQERQQFSWVNIGFALLFIGLTFALAYIPKQSDFGQIAIFYFPLFALFLLIYRRSQSNQELYFFLGLAVLARGILLFGMPQLSDDIYRFIWDGRLIIAGYNPFDHLPGYYLDQEVPGISLALFEQLNSPEYFTIYPPVAQGVFALACWIFPKSIWGAGFLIKLFLWACEIITIFLLPRLLSFFHLPKKNTLLYALNPLIIIEVCGNLHFEGAMVCFLLLAIWYLQKEKGWQSALMMALSIASKLLPLIFLPLLIRRLGWGKSLRYFLIVGVALVLLFLPLINGVFLSNIGESLDLYFRRFEFNASIYYLLRWIGWQISGFNLIAYFGPALALVVLLGVLTYAFFEKKPTLANLPLAMLFAICLYLFCTTTIHPWYTSLPIVLCLFTRFRFPIIWSGLIFLTYINYSYPHYFENLWVVGLEYVLVFGMLFLEYKEWRFWGKVA